MITNQQSKRAAEIRAEVFDHQAELREQIADPDRPDPSWQEWAQLYLRHGCAELIAVTGQEPPEAIVSAVTHSRTTARKITTAVGYISLGAANASRDWSAVLKTSLSTWKKYRGIGPKAIQSLATHIGFVAEQAAGLEAEQAQRAEDRLTYGPLTANEKAFLAELLARGVQHSTPEQKQAIEKAKRKLNITA